MKLLLQEVEADNLKVIWDVIHSLEYGETLEDSIAHLGSHIAHVHLKDGVAVSGQTEFLHTDLGAGQMPFGAVIQLLRGMHYQGFLSLEWESPWRPEIRHLYPDPLALLNRYAALLRQNGI
jgi:sugar phosphate isomerase/epimerase